MRVREHIMAMGRAFFLAFTASASAVMIVTMGEVMVAGQASPPAVFTIQQATAGKAGYAKNCASCHSPDLSGNGEIPALNRKLWELGLGAIWKLPTPRIVPWSVR